MGCHSNAVRFLLLLSMELYINDSIPTDTTIEQMYENFGNVIPRRRNEGKKGTSIERM